MMRVGIIGAGLVGTKRAANLVDARLIAVHDKDRSNAEKLALAHQANVEDRWQNLIRRPDIDAVIVATAHDGLAEYGAAALKAGKHVLVEKPGGRTPAEVKTLLKAARASRKVLRVGFNHRFHPSFQKAVSLVKENNFGPLLFIRARYGHGGRVGYEKEWRANRKISGGGELLDQGVHLIDLSCWLGGALQPAWGKTKTFFWPMAVEDYGFVALRSKDQRRWAWLHASWVEWKNIFNFELFYRNAKLEINGLGGSYGVEELKCFRMKPEMGPPNVDVWTFPGEDVSWKAEWQAFLASVRGGANAGARGEDALRTLEIVHWVYAENKKKR